MATNQFARDARNAMDRMSMRDSLISRQFAGSIIEDLRSYADADPSLEQAAAEARHETMCGHYGYSRDAAREKSFAFAEGIAFIPVHGTLINRFNSSWGFVTGYNFLRAQANAADADEDVKLIVFDYNSYGGEAAGCFELAREIQALETPTMAVIDSNCMSAAYALATGCDRIVCTPSGSVGSVGVYVMHVDMSKWLQDIGLKITFIDSPEDGFKVEGNSFEELSDSARANIQSSVKKRYDEFVALCAENRAMDETVFRDTKARVYRADEAQTLGLIDAVQTPSEAVSAYLAELADSEPNEEDDEMADAAKTEVTSEQRAAIEAETRQRIQGIQGCEEAKGRADLASHLAFNTSMSVDDAKATLKAAPLAVAAPAADTAELNADGTPKVKGGALDALMNSERQPGVEADGADAQPGDKAKVSRAQAALAAFTPPGEDSRASRALAN